MLWVYREDGTNGFSCKDDGHLYRHITEMENSKLLPGHPQFGQSEWGFIHFTSRRVNALYEHTPRHLRTPCLKRAYELEVGLAEIYIGNLHKPTEIVLTPDVDLQALQKQWCLDYCQAHGYQVVEKPAAPLQPVGVAWGQDTPEGRLSASCIAPVQPDSDSSDDDVDACLADPRKFYS